MIISRTPLGLIGWGGIFVYSISSGAASGTQLVLESKTRFPKPITCETTSIVESDRAHSETICKSVNFKSRVIYDRKKDKAVLVNDSNKTFIEWTRKELIKLKKAPEMGSAQTNVLKAADLAEKLKSVSSQHAPKNAQGLLPPSSGVTLKNTGRKKKIREWKCEIFEEHRQGRKTAELCVLPWKEAGAVKAHKDLFQAWGLFMAEISKTLPFGEGSSFWKSIEDVGVMVQRNEIHGPSGTQDTIELTSMKNISLDQGLYSIPENYQKLQLPTSTNQKRR